MLAAPKTRALFFTALLAVPVAAYAQDATEAPETEVVVTATRHRQPKQTASAPVTVITAAEIAASGAPTAAEALNQAVGVDVSRQGPLGSMATASIRGSGSSQVLILVDGRRLNNPQNGTADLTDIPSANIERIEVVRGGASALYGSDAIGGVINIITRDPGKTNAFSLMEGYGSLDTKLLSGRYDGSSGKIRYTFTGQRNSATNNFSYFNPTLGHNADRQHNGYSAWDLAGKLIADLGAGRRLTFSSEYGDADKDLPGSVTYATPQARQRDRRGLFDLRYETPAGEQGDFTARLYRVWLRNHYTDGGAYPEPADALHRTTMDVIELMGHTRAYAGNELTYGYELRDQRLRSTSIGKQTQDVHAFYAQDQITLNRLQVIPGARLDFIEGFSGELSPKLGMVYPIADGLVARANIGRSFRAPGMNDLYWPADAFTRGNPNLKPERALTSDIGASWEPVLGLELEASAFYNRTKDLIAWQPGIYGADVWSPVNVGKALVTGLEISAAWQASDRVSTHANFTCQNARDKSGAEGLDGKRLILRPEWLANAGATYRTGKTSFQMDLRYTGRRPADAANTRYLGGALLADAHIETPLRGSTVAALHVSNLFDKDYEMQPGYPLPGRTVSLQLSERW